MKPARHTVLGTVAALAAAVALAGCSSTPPEELESPVGLKPVPGTDRYVVTLTPRAEQRLGITTAAVRSLAGGAAAPGATSAVPYAAVVYDSSGATWAYTRSGSSFTRAAITVVTITGDLALLSDGPAVGTPVVTVGAPELLGAEAQIAGEE